MRNKNNLAFLTIVSLLAAGVCSSSSFDDNAGNAAYVDGWSHGDNGGNGSVSFTGWSMGKLEDSLCSAVDATSVGGSPLMNTNGLSWVLTASRVDETDSTARLVRDTGVTTPDGTVAQLDVQVLNDSGYSDIVFHGPEGQCLLLDVGIFTGGNWFVTDGDGTEDTGVDCAIPVRVRYVDGLVGNEYQFEMLDLNNGSVLYTRAGVSRASTAVDSVEILQTDLFKEPGPDTHFILNNLTFVTPETQSE